MSDKTNQADAPAPALPSHHSSLITHHSKSRSTWGHLPDGELLAQCDVDTYRASGPGGQKRNKTSSAVRLRHRPTGLIVIAEESRSQHENKAKAVRRLRRAVFLHLRDAPSATPAEHPDFAPVLGSDGRVHVSAKDARFWPAAGVVLDVLASTAGQVSTAAEVFGVSTANLVDFLAADPKLWQEANRIRIECGLKPLRVGG
jgi:hypothetical protein